MRAAFDTRRWKRNRFMCYDSVAERCSWQSGSSKAGSCWDTSHNLCYYATGCEVEPTSQQTTCDKLGLSLTCLIRISTVICYASCEPHARGWLITCKKSGRD